jgi:O-antigen/teichoic acid export membrane protein
MIDHADEKADIRRKVASGLGWKAVSQVLRQLTRLAVLVVVARALSPHEYGVAGMVLVFSSLVLIFADLALGTALVQRATLTELERSTVFWTSAFVGVVVTLLTVALAGPVASFFGEPDVEPLLRVFALSFILTSLMTVPNALLSRQMAWRGLELRSMGATVAGAATGVSLAVAGAGPWAIIAQQVVISATSLVLTWVLSAWRPRLQFSFAQLWHLGSFGFRLFGTRLVFYMERNADNLLVGRVLGPAALGVYSLAYNVMLVPLEQVGGPMAEVLFPALSRMQDDHARMRAAWLRAVRLLAALVAPAMLVLIVVADDVVAVVLGPKWSAVAPIVQVLAWVGLHQSLQRFNSSVLQALGKGRTLLRYAIFTSTVCLSGFAIGLHWGVQGVAVGYCIASTIVAPVYLVATTRASGMRVTDFFRAVGGVMIAAALTAAAVGAAQLALRAATSSPVERLAVLLPLAAALYLLLVRALAPEIYAEAGRLVPMHIQDRVRRLRPAWLTAGGSL